MRVCGGVVEAWVEWLGSGPTDGALGWWDVRYPDGGWMVRKV